MPYERTPLRGFRKIAQAFWTAPSDSTIYGSKHIDVSKARRFQDVVQAEHGVRPSMGQLVGKGIAFALTEVPQLNAKIIWGRPYIKDTIDVYFQVDMEGGKDLSGVVVPDAGQKSIVQIAEELRAYAERLRKGQDEQYEKTQKGCLGWLPVWAVRRLLGSLTFMEYNLGISPTFLGARPEPFGTVMVTNVSKFGIDVAYAPLVPVSRVPFVALVGAVEDRPWVVDGELQVRPVIVLSATFDHRIVDGNRIGKVVRTVVAYMQDPFAFEGEALGIDDPGEGAGAEAAAAEAEAAGAARDAAEAAADAAPAGEDAGAAGAAT